MVTQKKVDAPTLPGLTGKAAELFGNAKVEVVTPQPQVNTETGEVVEEDKVLVTFDSPKSDWEPLGHVQIQAMVPLTDVIDTWGNVLMTWQQARETFAELIEQHKAEENKASPKQLNYAQDLAAQLGLQIDFDGLDKYEIDKAIKDMNSKLSDKPQAATPTTVAEKPKWQGLGGNSGSTGGGGTGAWRSKPMSQKQRSKIIETANQRGIQLPADFLNFTSGEASDFMNQLWNKA